MGYVLEGGPRDGEYDEDLPSGYAVKAVIAGAVTEASPSPTPRAVWKGFGRSPKDLYTDQLIEEDYGNWGEGARREMFGD